MTNISDIFQDASKQYKKRIFQFLSSLKPCRKRCSMLQSNYILQYVAVCCSVLQCASIKRALCLRGRLKKKRQKSTAKHCEALQSTAKHCKALQSTAKHCKVLQSKELQSTAKNCKALQIISKNCKELQRTTKHCKALQSTAKYCNELQSTRDTTSIQRGYGINPCEFSKGQKSPKSPQKSPKSPQKRIYLTRDTRSNPES